MGKSQKKVQRKKIDVTKETDVLFKPPEQRTKKGGEVKTSDLFYEDKTASKSSTKRKWRNKMLHCDLVVSSDKKRVIDTSLAELDYAGALRKLENKRRHIEGPQKNPVAASGSYDLWGTNSRPADIHHKVDDPTGGWLSGVKTGPIPKGVKDHKITALPPVELPGNAESYIPQPEAYNDVVEEEVRTLEKIDKKNKKFEKEFSKINVKKITSGKETFLQRAMDIIDDDVDDTHVEMPGKDEIAKSGKNVDESKNISVGDDEIVSGKDAEDFPVVAKLKKEAKLRNLNKRSEYKGIPRNPNRFKKFVNSQLNDIDKIVAEAENKVAADTQKAILRRNRRKVLRNMPGYRLSKYRFRDSSKLLLTPDQLPSGLRTIPNATSLLDDRFVNMQKRNIIPTSMKRPSLPTPPSKKIKFVEKRIIRDGLYEHGGDEVEFIKSL